MTSTDGRTVKLTEKDVAAAPDLARALENLLARIDDHFPRADQWEHDGKTVVLDARAALAAAKTGGK